MKLQVYVSGQKTDLSSYKFVDSNKDNQVAVNHKAIGVKESIKQTVNSFLGNPTNLGFDYSANPKILSFYPQTGLPEQKLPISNFLNVEKIQQNFVIECPDSYPED